MKSIGFSVFRIMVGVTLLVGGYDKVMKLLLSGFEKNELGDWFVSSVHSDAVSPHISILLPKALLLAFGFLVPFWELFVGISVVVGIYRMLGAVFGMLLMAVFLIGGESMHAVDYPNMLIDIIQMYVFGFGYFFLYRELLKNPADPLALDTFLANRRRRDHE